jgi:hypothetical protein
MNITERRHRLVTRGITQRSGHHRVPSLGGRFVNLLTLFVGNVRRLFSEWRSDRRWRRTPIVSSHIEGKW